MKTEKDIRLYIDEEGRMQATLAKSERPEDEICDFCSSEQRPFKVYNCKDFEMPDGSHSLGGWNACPKCADYIDNNDKKGLTDRVILMFIGMTKDIPDAIVEHFTLMYDRFFENRIN